MRGKVQTRNDRHAFLFRRLLRCAHCGYSLIVERQKGRVHYRCHTKACLTTSAREETIDATLRHVCGLIQLTAEEAQHARRHFEERVADVLQRQTEAENALKLQRAEVTARLGRLTDALVDGAIDRRAFDERKSRLLLDRARIEEQHRDPDLLGRRESSIRNF